MNNIYIDQVFEILSQHSAAVQVFIAILLILLAIKILENGFNRLFWLLISLGVYLFSRGIITVAMIQQWISYIPEGIKMIFLIFK